jgi:hypothetical protein
MFGSFHFVPRLVVGTGLCAIVLLSGCVQEKEAQSYSGYTNRVQAYSGVSGTPNQNFRFAESDSQRVINAHRSTLELTYSTYRKSVMGLLSQSTLTQVLKDYLTNNPAVDPCLGYSANFDVLHDLCVAQGYNLRTAMRNSLVSNSGTTAELNWFDSSFHGFTIEDQGLSLPVKPALFVPYYNRSVYTGSWNGLAVDRVGESNPFSNLLTVWRRSGSGFVTSTFTKDVAGDNSWKTTPMWWVDVTGITPASPKPRSCDCGFNGHPCVNGRNTSCGWASRCGNYYVIPTFSIGYDFVI